MSWNDFSEGKNSDIWSHYKSVKPPYNSVISFAAAVTPDDWADLARYQTMRQFAAFGRGIHLGGLFDQQSILQWKMSAADAVRQLPAGVGYALATSGDCVRLLTPLTEGGSK